MPDYQITISRLTDASSVPDNRWKELVSALVLAGYEVHADEEKIVFELGGFDHVEAKENSND